MIIEDYCSFETALLLKEKGFDAEIKTYWCKGAHDEPIFEFIPNARNHDISNSEGYIHFNGHQSELEDKPICIAPTLQIAMKWLREKYNLFIEIQCYGCGADEEAHFEFSFVVSEFMQFDNKICTTVGLKEKKAKSQHNTYEEACEAAIKYCLENLI